MPRRGRDVFLTGGQLSAPSTSCVHPMVAFLPYLRQVFALPASFLWNSANILQGSSPKTSALRTRWFRWEGALWEWSGIWELLLWDVALPQLHSGLLFKGWWLISCEKQRQERRSCDADGFPVVLDLFGVLSRSCLLPHLSKCVWPGVMQGSHPCWEQPAKPRAAPGPRLPGL